MTVAYGDGSIQCLLRDSLQQIGSVDLPSNVGKNDMLEPPSSKIARCLLPTSHLSFSPNGNALVVLDSLGQMCLYRMSPTADPGGEHAPATLTTQFLYALLSGSDTWDIQVKLHLKNNGGRVSSINVYYYSDKFQICMKGNQVENICERLADEYHKQQPMSNQTLLHNRFKALKLAMLRLPMTEATDFKAADIYADLILTSIQVWPLTEFLSVVMSS